MEHVKNSTIKTIFVRFSSIHQRNWKYWFQRKVLFIADSCFFFSLLSFSLISKKKNFKQQHHPSEELHYAELSSISLARGATTDTPSTAQSTNFNASTLPKKPPAYDYFVEPTVYAQIDHFKTIARTEPTQSTSTLLTNCNRPSTTITTMSPTKNPLTAHHPTYQTHLVTSASATSPFYDVGDTASHDRSNGSLNNSNTMTLLSIQSPTTPSTSYQKQNNQSPTQQPQNTTSKSFSREIVTIRTPLLYSQQESCV